MTRVVVPPHERKSKTGQIEHVDGYTYQRRSGSGSTSVARRGSFQSSPVPLPEPATGGWEHKTNTDVGGGKAGSTWTEPTLRGQVSKVGSGPKPYVVIGPWSKDVPNNVDQIGSYETLEKAQKALRQANKKYATHQADYAKIAKLEREQGIKSIYGEAEDRAIGQEQLRRRVEANKARLENRDKKLVNRLKRKIGLSEEGVEMTEDSALAKLAASFTTDKREQLQKKGHAFKNSNGEASYPIPDVEHLEAAIKAFGRSKDEDKPKLKQFIMKRARALGHPELIPDDWQGNKVSASAIDRLGNALALSESGDGDPKALELAKGRLDWSPKHNWVEDAGGLPKYIEDIALALIRDHGFTREHAISTAVNRVKKWAAGTGNVNADTRAKAAAAVAAWEALKVKSKAKTAAKHAG